MTVVLIEPVGTADQDGIWETLDRAACTVQLDLVRLVPEQVSIRDMEAAIVEADACIISTLTRDLSDVKSDPITAFARAHSPTAFIVPAEGVCLQQSGPVFELVAAPI